MDKVVDKLVGLGVAGLVIAVLISTSGLVGAAAITASLALLGGPFGMLGGIAVFGIMTMTASAIGKYGIDAIAKRIVRGLRENGKSKKEILKEIEDFPIISRDLKEKLKIYVDQSS